MRRLELGQQFGKRRLGIAWFAGFFPTLQLQLLVAQYLIQRTLDPLQALQAYMRISQGGFDIVMAQQLLDIADIGTVLQQMRGITVAQTMKRNGWRQAKVLIRLMKHGLCRTLTDGLRPG